MDLREKLPCALRREGPRYQGGKSADELAGELGYSAENVRAALTYLVASGQAYAVLVRDRSKYGERAHTRAVYYLGPDPFPEDDRHVSFRKRTEYEMDMPVARGTRDRV